MTIDSKGPVLSVASRSAYRNGWKMTANGKSDAFAGIEQNNSKNGTRAKLGKKNLFRKAVSFFFQGWVMLRNVYVEDEASLANAIPRQLISRAAKYVQEWREFAVDKENRFTKPVTVK